MSTDPDQAMQKGLRHHRAGQLSEAETIYREVLAQNPDHIDALHLLGVIAHQVNRDDIAEQLIRRAIEIAPLIPDFHNSLGQAIQSSGRIDEAVDCYLRAIAMEPNFGDAFANLGIARRLQRQWPEAIAALQQAAVLQPNNLQVYLHLAAAHLAAENIDRAVDVLTTATQIDPTSAQAFSDLTAVLQKQNRLEAATAAARQATRLQPDRPRLQHNLGLLLQQQQRHDDAIAAFLAALSLYPDNAEILGNLATSLHARHRYNDAAAALKHALSLRPNAPELFVNLGAALQAAERFDDATAAFSQAVTLKPDFAEAHNNLGYCLLVKQQLDDAIITLKKAIELDPACAPAYANLGLALRKQGRHLESIATYRQALALRPQMRVAHSNILLSMNYEPQFDAQTVFDEHVAWAKTHLSDTVPIGPLSSHDRNPNRRLRIGYVSPDLRHHVIAYFIEPLLAAHDRAGFEIVCYSSVRAPDELTARLRRLTDHWHDVAALSDEQLAERVRADRIDILIDLAGHNEGRLALFARKPAPIQVAYLGYPNTTGLTEIDYRLTDACADPLGMTDPFFTETLWRLPRCAWCFAPPDCPEITPLPADAARHITFGSFNKFTKLSSPLLTAWAALLAAMPDARLRIKSSMLGDESARRILNDSLQSHKLPLDRCEVIGTVDQSEHLAAYGQVDIALDAFPYHGTTTTCESLYMGVPVITLAGDRHVSRVGVSLLNAVRLPELIADSWEQYITKAIELASDRDHLRQLRNTLRSKMEQSPLMDGPGLAREIESAYRQMRRTWCAS